MTYRSFIAAAYAALSVALLSLAALLSGCAGGSRQDSTNQPAALSFDTLTYSRIDTADASLRFSLIAEMALPEDYGTEALRNNIISDVLGRQFTGKADRRLLENYADTIRAEMTIPEIEDFAGTVQMRYEEKLHGSVTFAADSFLCYSRTLYIYQGGAHGLQTVQHFTYRLPDGTPLHEDDVFDPAAKDRLTELLVSEADRLRNDTILPREKNEYFNDRNIVPNGNFHITDSGIVYQYNPYDIAPYSFGAVEIMLPADKVMPLLNRQSPVFGFFFGKRR